MFCWLQKWFENAFNKGLEEGWGDCGEFLLQSSIALLSFSAFMPKFLQHVVAPARVRLAEKNKSVQEFNLLPGEEISEQTEAIIRNTKRKSSTAASDYDRNIELIIKKGKTKSGWGAFFAACLMAMGAHHWLGPLVLLTLWPVFWMFVASVLVERKASEKIAKAFDKLDELQEDVAEGQKLLGTLDKLEDVQTSQTSNREKEEDCLGAKIKEVGWKLLESLFLCKEMR